MFMKGFYFFIIGILSILSWGCNEVQGTEPSGNPDMILTIKNVTTDTGSITLTLHAEGEDKDDYIRWGITYGETEDKALGKGMGIDGSPAEGSGEVTIEGLKDNTVYYIWGWAFEQ